MKLMEARWAWCLASLLVGCGDESEALQQYRPRICGQEGPVQVLSVERWPAAESSAHERWQVGTVGSRWVVRRFMRTLSADGSRTDIEAHVVDPCGEHPVRLPARTWPLSIGDALFGCNVDDGTVFEIDPETGQSGEVLATGIACDPIQRTPETLLLHDRAAARLAVLDGSGELIGTPVPLPDGGSDLELAPYLSYPVGSHRVNEGVVWLRGNDAGLWRVEADGMARRVLDNVRRVTVDDSTGLVVVALEDSVEESDSSLHPTLVIDPVTEESWPGPPVEYLMVAEGYLFVPGGFFDLSARSLHPYPSTIPENMWAIGVHAEGYGLLFEQRFAVWNIASGELLVDQLIDAKACSAVSIEGATAVISWATGDDCASTEVWAYPLDGSDPELIAVERRHPGSGKWTEEGSLNYYLQNSGEPFDLIYTNDETGKASLIDHDVQVLVSPGGGQALEQEPFDRYALNYVISEGERTGLWRSELPR